MPGVSFDAPENLQEQAPCQVAIGQPQDEVPSVSDELPADLEESPLETGP